MALFKEPVLLAESELASLIEAADARNGRMLSLSFGTTGVWLLPVEGNDWVIRPLAEMRGLVDRERADA